MGSNKYIITKIECWPVFKQDPTKASKFPLFRRGVGGLYQHSDVPRECSEDAAAGAGERAFHRSSAHRQDRLQPAGDEGLPRHPHKLYEGPGVLGHHQCFL